jgi:hypothetical protein
MEKKKSFFRGCNRGTSGNRVFEVAIKENNNKEEQSSKVTQFKKESKNLN